MIGIHFKNKIYNSRFIILAIVLFLAVPASTQGYFSDPVNAADAHLSAGTLEVSLSPSKSALTLSASSGDTMTFSADSIGTLSGQYKVTAAPTSCNSGFWSGVLVSVNKSGLLYDGSLDALLATSTTDGDWTIDISASSTISASDHETCDFDVVVSTWQDEFTTDVLGGFTDTETFHLTLTFNDNTTPLPTSDVVLNEVYPNPNVASSSPLNFEWIELYNGTSAAIDVDGFIIGELSGAVENQHTLVADCSGYPSASYAQPYGTNNTVIPAGGLLVVEFCGSASYLNDGGDTVALYNASSTQLDVYTYTSSIKGKSIARIPDGSVWVDPVPTPGSRNIATENELREAGWSKEEIGNVLGIEESIEGTPKFTFATKPDMVSTSTATTTFATASTSDSKKTEITSTSKETSGEDEVLPNDVSTSTDEIATSTDSVAASSSVAISTNESSEDSTTLVTVQTIPSTSKSSSTKSTSEEKVEVKKNGGETENKTGESEKAKEKEKVEEIKEEEKETFEEKDSEPIEPVTPEKDVVDEGAQSGDLATE